MCNVAKYEQMCRNLMQTNAEGNDGHLKCVVKVHFCVLGIIANIVQTMRILMYAVNDARFCVACTKTVLSRL